jgi:hypothetical protein
MAGIKMLQAGEYVETLEPRHLKQAPAAKLCNQKGCPMTGPAALLQPNAARTLELWHRMVAIDGLGRVGELMHSEIVFRSPAVFKPYHGATAASLILNSVAQVFEGFVYHRQMPSPDGLSITLEFTARIGDKSIKGVDIISFDANGLIAEFEVLIRPLNALQALAEIMADKLKR